MRKASELPVHLVAALASADRMISATGLRGDGLSRSSGSPDFRSPLSPEIRLRCMAFHGHSYGSTGSGTRVPERGCEGLTRRRPCSPQDETAGIARQALSRVDIQGQPRTHTIYSTVSR